MNFNFKILKISIVIALIFMLVPIVAAEDATDSVTGNFVHQFENKSKTASKWGVLIRVTVGRNGGSGECYVSAIGGNFE